MNKLCAVTYCSNPNEEGHKKLIKSAVAWGWDFKSIIGGWNGFASKMNGVYSMLDTLHDKGYTHVLFTDAYDTLVTGPVKDVLDQCDDRIHVSCEVACWPDEKLMKDYPNQSPPSRWKHVNSGGYMGSIDSLRKMLQGVHGDDQLWLTRKYLEEPFHYKLDYYCNIFQTLGHTVLPWATWDKTFDKLPSGRLHNKETHGYPVFVHGNGRALMGWMEDMNQPDLKGTYEELKMETMVSVPVEREVVPVPEPVQKPLDYNDIPGFGVHDFAGFYNEMVRLAPFGAILIEVGCFNGRSLVQLGLAARKANKALQVVGIDHCEDQSGGCEHAVRENLRKFGLDVEQRMPSPYNHPDKAQLNIISPPVRFIKGKSVEVAKEFRDDSVWFVFLDDDHRHEAVAAGIDAWMPKVTEDGYLAGHDARWHTVWQAVQAKLINVLHDPMWDDCWWTRKGPVKPHTDPALPEHVNIYKDVQHDHPIAPWGYGCKERKLRNDGKPSGSPIG